MLYKHHEHNPLAIDLLLLDEASMLDIVLFYHVLKAIPKTAALILVGDVDQLPSVGSGAVLSDLIQSATIATVKLSEIFRQAQDSQIIVNAHRINQGLLPLGSTGMTDFYTLYREDSDDIQATLLKLVAERIPKHLGCVARDIQVLTHMKRGGLGSRALNLLLRQRLNGQAAPKVMRYGWTFAPGDKVIQNVNNYDKEVFNGDMGLITRIDLENSVVYIDFDHKEMVYDFNDLDELSLAYAVSIHKSQGSEFPVVIVLLAMQHYNLLARKLLYTAVTRGKQLVMVLGQQKALAMAVRNNQAGRRLTKLADRLQQAEALSGC
jgi:exodeoxyribonuclease V alpha subunit